MTRSLDSSAGIATGYGLANRGVVARVPVGSRILFSPRRQTGSGGLPNPIQWVPGALSPGVKRQGLEADHSHPTRAKVKKMWIIHPLPLTPSWRSA
jgi:hypothetical protein